MEICKKCGGCCKYIAIEVDKPKTKEDYDEIIWMLLHENISVSIDNDNEWVVELSTPCKMLGKNNECKAYEKRPNICKIYDPNDCVNNGKGKAEKILFKTREDFIKYLKKKGLDTSFLENPKDSKNI